MDERMAEINALKSLLRDTDYTVMAFIEDFAQTTTATQAAKVKPEFLEKRGELLEKRREWRRKINELEAETEVTGVD